MSEYDTGYRLGYKAGYQDGQKAKQQIDEASKDQTYYCDICDASFTGTRQAASDRGWSLHFDYCFCPDMKHD